MSLPTQFLLRWYKYPESLLYALLTIHNTNEFILEKRPPNLDTLFYQQPQWHSQEPIRKIFWHAGKQYRSAFMYTGLVAYIGSSIIEIWDIIDHVNFISNDFIHQEEYHFILIPPQEHSYESYESYEPHTIHGGSHGGNTADSSWTDCIPTLVPPPRQKYTSVRKTILDFCSLNKDATCPITMEPYTKSTICITPCGHGIQYRAMTQWLQTSNQCPLCRSHMNEADLIRWS